MVTPDVSPHTKSSQNHRISAPARHRSNSVQAAQASRQRSYFMQDEQHSRAGTSFTTYDDEMSTDRPFYSFDTPTAAGCNVTESFCDFGFYPRKTTNHHQPPPNAVDLETQQKVTNDQIRDLNVAIAKLHARNQVLEKENCAALQQAHQTTTTSDGTVQALQQRCQEVESKNLQLADLVTALQTQQALAERHPKSATDANENPPQNQNTAQLDVVHDQNDDEDEGPRKEKELDHHQELDEIKLQVASERSEKLRYKDEVEQLTKSLLSAQTALAVANHTVSSTTNNINNNTNHPSGSSNGGPDQVAAGDPVSVAALDRVTKAWKESELRLVNLQSEQHKLRNEHATTIQKLQSDLAATKEDYLEAEVDLKAQIENLQLRQLQQHRSLSPPIVGDNTIELLNQRDDTIASLRQQCLDLSRHLTTMQAETAVTSTKSIDTSEENNNNNSTDRIVSYLQKELDDSHQAFDMLQIQLREAETMDQTCAAELRSTIQQLEELSKSKDESIRNLEQKYGVLERHLLEAKLGLAAAAEAKEQLIDQHQHSLEAAEQTKEKITQELKRSVAMAEEDKKRLVEEQKVSLDAVEQLIGELKLSLAAAEEENERGVEEYERRISELQSMLECGDDDEKKTDDTTSAAGETAVDAHQQIATLTVEVDRLNYALQQRIRDEDDNRLQGGTQRGGSLAEDLRRELEQTRQAESDLRDRLDDAAREHLKYTLELQHHLEARDTRIAALVQTSAALDGQIEASQQEIEILRAQVGQGGFGGSANQTREIPAINTEPNDSMQAELAAQKQKVEELSAKMKSMKKLLVVAKNDNARLRAQLLVESKAQDIKLVKSVDADEVTDSDSAATLSTTQRLLNERDNAISSLVKQAIAQDRLVSELRNEIEDIKNKSVVDKDNDEKSSRIAVEQLQQEAEVFAGQVIELDGEIESLKSALSLQESLVADLEKQLTVAKSQPAVATHAAKILDLEAEIDELKEANLTQRNELRDLRRKVWEAEASSDEITRSKNEVLEARQEADSHKRAAEELDQDRTAIQKELEAERATKASIEQSMRKQLQKLQQSRDERIESLTNSLQESQRAFDQLKASPGHMSEEDIVALQNEITSLRHDLSNQAADVDSAKTTIRELEGMLAEKSAEEAAAFEEEKEELLAEIESLTHQLDEVQRKIETLETDAGIIDEFKEKLERADDAREASEKNIIDTFERRLSLLTLDKDVTIDNLRNELIVEKETNAEELEEVTNQLKVYQVEISELREVMEEEVEMRETRIFELGRTLKAQEQLVANMKTEMDHLQGSMEGSAARRKEENDEMQQELLTMTAAAAKQEREIQSLKLEIDACTSRHQAVIAKLEEKIAAMENIPQEHRNANDLQMELRVKEVKDRLEKLKWRNTSLKEENLNLRERLEQAEALAKENADDRSKDLEEQLLKQITKVKRLESELKSTKEPPVSVLSQSPPHPVAPLPAVDESTPQTGKKSTPVDAVTSQTDKKVSAASPRRLLIFGWKRTNEGPSDDAPLKK